MASRSIDGNGLGSKHVVFLAMTSTGLAVVFFLLGVMVGRGASILDIVTGGQAAGAGREETFAADEQPFVARITQREPSMAATDGTELSYFQRLDDDGGPELDSGLMEPPAPPTTAGTGAAHPLEGDAAGRSGSYAGQAGGYAIQVTTLRESTAAERMAQGLVQKGYPAFVVPPPPGSPVSVFRVRVGTYADREQAEQVLRRLEGEESFKPWITR